MLFHPRRAWRLGPFSIQGIVPRRRIDLAERISTVIESELLSQHIIREQIHKIDLSHYLQHFIHRLIHERLGRQLQRIPLLGAMINNTTLGSFERIAHEAIKDEIEPIREKLATEMEARIKVKELIEARILALDIDRVESLVLTVAAREFRQIELLGGILGFIVGIMQLLLLLLSEYL